MWHLDNENELFCGYIAVGLTICCSLTNRKYYQSYNIKQKILWISAKLSLRDVVLYIISYDFQNITWSLMIETTKENSLDSLVLFSLTSEKILRNQIWLSLFVLLYLPAVIIYINWGENCVNHTVEWVLYRYGFNIKYVRYIMTRYRKWMISVLRSI